MNDHLPDSLNRFAQELELAIRRDLPPRRGRRLIGLLQARPRLLAGTTIAAAGTGAVLAIVLGAAGSSPAFAVTHNRDGSYSVTLRSLTAIPAANRTLSQMGLHAALVKKPAPCPAQRPPLHARIPAPLPAAAPPRHRRTPAAQRPPLHARVPAPASAHLRIPVCGPAPMPANS